MRLDVGDPRLGIHTDENIISVNASQKLYENDLLCFACKANQVSYLDDLEYGGA